MDRTTVIVPTFERAGYLRECLDAVFAQTLPPGEVVVVDDGSQDDTAAVLESYGSRVRAVRKAENSGKAASLDLGLSLAACPLIWIVDDDDVVRPDALERLTALLAEHPRAGFAYGRHVRFEVDPDTGERRVMDTGYWRRCEPDEFLVATLEDFFAHQPGMLVRKSLYNRVGGFDSSLDRSQDYDMLIRLAAAAPAVSTDAVVFEQRVHAGPRGSGARRFAASRASQKWIEADQRIMRRSRAALPLEAYLPRKTAPLAPEERRRALLQRAVIMARKRLWEESVADLRSAAEATDAPLVEEDKEILRRTFSSKYGLSDMMDDEHASMLLVEAARTSAPVGIGPALSRGLRWRVREALAARRLRYATRLMHLMAALHLPRVVPAPSAAAAEPSSDAAAEPSSEADGRS